MACSGVITSLKGPGSAVKIAEICASRGALYESEAADALAAAWIMGGRTPADHSSCLDVPWALKNWLRLSLPKPCELGAQITCYLAVEESQTSCPQP
jgi:hypothetical protein